eukprot:NODE_881_length_1792_cov_28.327928_g825_i0.p1 GENE.NODE_881_length_1792_cov_28.327928_g825_i0~~NODE_881_length_1792_cov_28.327928_g825_i0.p1  ORF type:complete len:577 (-),score=153.47 NODE_881_length_1792_cov_28.327928_g825_i0:62-1762(-)
MYSIDDLPQEASDGSYSGSEAGAEEEDESRWLCRQLTHATRFLQDNRFEVPQEPNMGKDSLTLLTENVEATSVALFETYQCVAGLVEKHSEPPASSSLPDLQIVQTYLEMMVKYHKRILQNVNSHRAVFAGIEGKCTALKEELCTSQKDCHRAQGELQRLRQVSAVKEEQNQGPRGHITLVFTDVQSSTFLWENFPTDMKAALGRHNTLMRDELTKHSGFEVKTEGDAFMVAFQSVTQALDWGVAVQRRLLQTQWPKALLDTRETCTVRDANGQPIFYGLRVRMGMNSGNPEAQVDPITERTDYFGPAVNLAARIEGMAKGGQIACGSSGFLELQKAGHLSNMHVEHIGEKKLKGIALPEAVVLLTSLDLMARVEWFASQSEERALHSPTTALVSHESQKQVFDELYDLQKDLSKWEKDMEVFHFNLDAGLTALPQYIESAMAPTPEPEKRRLSQLDTELIAQMRELSLQRTGNKKKKTTQRPRAESKKKPPPKRFGATANAIRSVSRSRRLAGNGNGKDADKPKALPFIGIDTSFHQFEPDDFNQSALGSSRDLYHKTGRTTTSL